jgi:hypothetical protein
MEVCHLKWFIQFHWSAEVKKLCVEERERENKICFITRQGKKKGCLKEKQEIMKPGREVCERMQLDSDDTFNENISDIKDTLINLSP